MDFPPIFPARTWVVNPRDAMMSRGRLTIAAGNVWLSRDYAREHPARPQSALHIGLH